MIRKGWGGVVSVVSGFALLYPTYPTYPTVNLKVIGTVGLIRLAWQKGLINAPVEELYKLKSSGFWIDESLIEIFRMH